MRSHRIIHIARAGTTPRRPARSHSEAHEPRAEGEGSLCRIGHVFACATTYRYSACNRKYIDGRTANEVVALLLGQSGVTSHELLQNYWKAKHSGGDFDMWWRKSLEQGWIEGTASQPKQVAVKSTNFPSSNPSASGGGSFRSCGPLAQRKDKSPGCS